MRALLLIIKMNEYNLPNQPPDLGSSTNLHETTKKDNTGHI